MICVSKETESATTATYHANSLRLARLRIICKRAIPASSISGRLRWNLEHQPRAGFTASEYGQLLPSNAALEVSLQYRSVMVFGTAQIVTDDDEKRRALDGMLAKYFPQLRPGHELRPITDRELQRTSVYALLVESWSGKENWSEAAEQTTDWPALPDALRAPRSP